MPDRPTPGQLEQRTAPEPAATPTVEGRRLRGRVPYGVESRDLGGWKEIMEPGCLRGARLDDLVATVDHAGVPIGRHPRTLEVEDTPTELRWSVDLPESRGDIREAVERGDLCAGSWRMVVARDEWRGDVRHVHEVAELRDVSVVTAPAYGEAARAEYRSAPENPPTETTEEAPVPEETNPAGGLRVEDRAAASADEPSVESRVIDAIRSTRRGEVRDLTNATASAISPPELSTYLWDRLRPMSIMLAAGARVITTDSRSVTWPRLTADVDPGWYAETEVILEGDPAFAQLTATPKKLAHRVELSNEVIDDSEPSIVDVLNGHLATMLALKFDLSAFEGNPTADPDSIRGLKYVAGIQSISMGTNGAPLLNYDPFLQAVGALRASNVPPPYAIAANPRTLLALELLRRETGSNEQLGAPAGLPPFFTTSQLSVTESKGTAVNASSAYVFAPAEVVVVRRQDSQIELDRSRLFDRDMSEVRAKLRADLIVPNPVAIVRIDGIIPA